MKECPEEASLNKLRRIYGSDPGALRRRNVPASKGPQSGKGAASSADRRVGKGRGRDSQGLTVLDL